MCYGKEDGKRNKQKHLQECCCLFRFSSPFPEHIPIIETSQQDAEMLIVVTSNYGKKNSTRLGKITSVDFNYKTCLVGVPIASYCCAV